MGFILPVHAQLGDRFFRILLYDSRESGGHSDFYPNLTKNCPKNYYADRFHALRHFLYAGAMALELLVIFWLHRGCRLFCVPTVRVKRPAPPHVMEIAIAGRNEGPTWPLFVGRDILRR